MAKKKGAKSAETKLAKQVIEKLKEVLGKRKKRGVPEADEADLPREHRPGGRPDVDPNTGKPVYRTYEHNPKHRDQPYYDRQRGETVSRRPRQGDEQEILDNSVPKPGSDRHRIGIEPGTGKPVELRRHWENEWDDRIEEKYHGYVPDDE